MEYLKSIRRAKQLVYSNYTIVENFTYVTILQAFILLAPLITYPYLVRVLGIDLYGVVITAQVLASYASIIIDFGSNAVCAKFVSINRNNKEVLSEIVSSVLIVRGVLSLICFVVYCIIVYLVPTYRTYASLFLLSYGMTFNDVLFPQYFFQGIEKMKYSTIINIGIKSLFIILVFFLVKSEEQLLIVPILYSCGYIIAGIISMFIIFNGMGLRFYFPPIERMKYYIKESSAIFATDLICTIKDKFSYFLLGAGAGMGNVVVYDLGLKINSLLTKPVQIVSTVLFPRFAANRSLSKFKKVLLMNLSVATILVIITNIFLPQIVHFFLHEEIDLIPLRLFSIAPILLSVSSTISSNLFVAFGYNKLVLYSIIITTSAYIVAVVVFYFSGFFDSIYTFIAISLISYFAEFLYRCIKTRQIFRKNEQ